jgi:hypothetical protein
MTLEQIAVTCTSAVNALLSLQMPPKLLRFETKHPMRKKPLKLVVIGIRHGRTNGLRRVMLQSSSRRCWISSRFVSRLTVYLWAESGVSVQYFRSVTSFTQWSCSRLPLVLISMKCSSTIKSTIKPIICDFCPILLSEVLCFARKARLERELIPVGKSS